MAVHNYKTTLTWKGNLGSGTLHYAAYKRDFEINNSQKQIIYGSSDPEFRGDESRYNPEELLVSSLSACHMLWYLHLCSDREIVVLDYSDNATGTMTTEDSGSGKFTKVTLRPTVKIIDDKRIEMAKEIHAKAHKKCFIANSVNFPIIIEPKILTD